MLQGGYRRRPRWKAETTKAAKEAVREAAEEAVWEVAKEVEEETAGKKEVKEVKEEKVVKEGTAEMEAIRPTARSVPLLSSPPCMPSSAYKTIVPLNTVK